MLSNKGKNSIFKKMLQGCLTHALKFYSFYRFGFLIFTDFLITFFSFVIAIYIYTMITGIPYPGWVVYVIVSIAFLVKSLSFIVYRIYNISFQHASALYIIKVSLVIFGCAIVDYFLLKRLFPAYWFIPIAILEVLLDSIASVSFRFLPLLYNELSGRYGEASKNCLVYGCGNTGKSLIPILRQDKVKIRGFIDDNSNNLHKVITGIRVLGKLDDLEKILTNTYIDVLIIAIPSLSGTKTKYVREVCSKFNIELKTMFSLHEIYDKSTDDIARSIRHINYDDLIRRPVKKGNLSDLSNFFKSRKTMITGAGSIGTELVKQLANLGAGEIVVLDNCELNLFNLEGNIPEKHREKIKTRLIDLKNKRLLSIVMLSSTNQIFFCLYLSTSFPMSSTTLPTE